MTRYGQTRDSLGKHSLAPKKRFGQNFLVNKKTAESIVHAAKVTGDDTILEVGVGLGALTQPLAEKASAVIGLEVDSGIIRFHQQENDLPGNVTLIHQDVLQADFIELSERCGGPLKIVANLPYSISNPFIFKLIENRKYVERATVMVQKEVAERLTAAPSTKEYGIPSVLLQSCASISKLLTLRPAEFHPRPKIDSTVIGIHFNRETLYSTTGDTFDFSLFQQIVRTSFNQRRKTISNTLSKGRSPLLLFSTDKTANKKVIEEAIRSAGFEPTIRPEVLSVEDFIQLTLSLEKQRNL